MRRESEMRVPSGEDPGGFTSSASPEESARFGFEVRRYAIGHGDERRLIEAIRTEAPSLAIVRLPSTRPDLLRRFREICGDVILGDCLVVYRRDNVRHGRPEGPANDTFATREATAADFDLLERLTDEIFVDYRNHYAANPRLAGFDLSEGYREWTRGHVGTPGRRCLVGTVDGEACCYGTVRLDPDECEIVLNGVVPAYRGRGVYRDLLRAMIGLFVDEGAARSMISTQVDNAAVQRVWIREGFFPDESFFTVHLNF
jgi:GNAT superfamily N-acetyltransferase